ncbi:hypothetical protein BHM03_00014772 [Ensete ventricosum]|nr:hypothetical protein BHM03_00014772 [Ensete ventricosum]
MLRPVAALRPASPPLLVAAPCGHAAGSPLWVHRGQPPAGWSQSVTPSGGRPLRAVASTGGRQPPCRGALAAIGRPYRGGGGGLAVASRPLVGGLGRN